MAEVFITVTSDLPEVGARVAAAGEAAQPLAEAMLREAGEAIKNAAIPILADHTPHRTGELAASTTGEVSGGGDEVIIDLYQPALSQPGPGGRGGGVEYVKFVVLGRGDVYPIEAKALAGNDGFGPVAHAGPAAPDPYPEEAAPEMSAAMDEIAAKYATELLEKLRAMM